jgi:hypothetical protein
LCFRDSEGWLSIHGRDIEKASSFRGDNVSLLGYIRDLNSTNVFRFPLNCDHLVRRPGSKLPSKHIADFSQPEFVQSEKASLGSSPEIQRDLSPVHPKKRIIVVFWSYPEKSPWGSEQRRTFDIECDATGSHLLKAFSEHFDIARDLLTGHEIHKVFPDLKQMKMMALNERICPNDGDILQIQPAIPPAQACPVALIIGSKTDTRPIDFRRIRISCGQLNLSKGIPQNSFRSMIAKLVGGSDLIDDIDVVMEKNGVQISASDGIFVLEPPIAEGVKHFSYVRLVVKSGFSEFDRLASDRRDHKDQTPLASDVLSISTIASDSPPDQQYPKRISGSVNQNESKLRMVEQLSLMLCGTE